MWIYEQAGWPQFSWDEAALSGKLASLRFRQGLLLGKMQGLGFSLQEETSLEVLTQDVRSSSAIEGEDLRQDEVRSSLARHLGIQVAGLVPTSRQVDGVCEMMLDATQRHDQPLTKERLFGWHAALFPTGYSGLHRIDIGIWRKASSGSMQVISGAYGREKVHFEAPAAEHLEKEMQAFLDWFATPNKLDPILRAGVAHFWFVTIHPFEDGNGRIARAIADMALAQADRSSLRFYSMSSEIARQRASYYSHLERQQRSDLDITRWLLWFMNCLENALERAESTVEHIFVKARFWERANAHKLDARQAAILEMMLDTAFVGHMNSSKYATLAKCSKDTALRDIQELLSYGLLTQNPGGGRSTSYRLQI